MKTVTFICASLFLCSAFAGEVTCYKTSLSVPAFIPKTFCLDSISLDSDQDLVTITNPGVNTPRLLLVKNLIRRNEDFLRFTASAVIREFIDRSCGELTFAELNVSADSTLYGETNVSDLDVSVSYETTPDFCHSPSVRKVVQYQVDKK